MISDMIGAAFVVTGIVIVITAVAGVFRFKYVLNRIHAASLCDTMGLLFTLTGLMIILGLGAHMFKILTIVVFMWLASPVVSHLTARAEVMTYPHLSDQCEVHTENDTL